MCKNYWQIIIKNYKYINNVMLYNIIGLKYDTWLKNVIFITLYAINIIKIKFKTLFSTLGYLNNIVRFIR